MYIGSSDQVLENWKKKAISMNVHIQTQTIKPNQKYDQCSIQQPCLFHCKNDLWPNKRIHTTHVIIIIIHKKENPSKEKCKIETLGDYIFFSSGFFGGGFSIASYLFLISSLTKENFIYDKKVTQFFSS